jgi:hypothetical protein
MTHLQERWFLACGVLVISACGAEVGEHSISNGLQQGSDQGSAERDALVDSVVMDEDDSFTGAAGSPADQPARASGTIFGVADPDLTGSVTRAAGSTLSGEVRLYCCRAGTYDVYSYEGGRCDDADSWLVENSARLATVTCEGDSGAAPYVRDPSDASTLAVVIYDAAGAAVGCAEVTE